MVIQRIDLATRVKRERIRLAISLAMESRWQEAVATNRLILEADRNDIDALNRLGKALSEIGHYTEAREAFAKALAISRNNPIAKKNLDRIASLRDEKAARTQHTRVAPQFFIEETGKTGISKLVELAGKNVLARISAGEPVELKSDAHRLTVRTAVGEYLGTVEPKMGLRLLGLMRGGNRYAGAVASIEGDEVKVFIRETSQHLSQRGKLSFPPKGLDDFRPYVWEGAYRVGQDDGDDVKSRDGFEWGEGEEDETARPIRRRAVAVGADDEEEY
ncbi:MAG: tetratricopeptide repeat protein [Chloroflexi bacterium]|nr:tetratricopeptide repeat protein [Chloroflexota bacterium]